MSIRKRIDAVALIEKQPFGWLQLSIVLNVCAVMLVEGYDMQVTPSAAPAIMKEWHLTTAYFGPVFGFGLFGYLLGGTVLSYLGDRLGRGTMILSGSFAFGALRCLPLILRLLLHYWCCVFSPALGWEHRFPPASHWLSSIRQSE